MESQLAHLPSVDLKQKMIPVAFVLMWSSGAIFVSIGLQYADPFIFLFLRLFLSTLLFWLLTLWAKTELPTKLNEWIFILLTGLCMQAGYQIFYFLALDNQLSPGVLAIFLGVQPIITSFFLKKENGKAHMLGLLLGFAGLIMVVADTILIGSFTIFGVISALLSLFFITIGTVMQKYIKTNQLSNMAIQYSGGTLVLFLLILLYDQSIKWTAMFTVSLIWMVFIISVGATLLLYHMIQKGNLVNVTSLFYAVPPVTALLDYLFFKNSLEFLTILGMGFIIAGLLLINQKAKVLYDK
jgi:drug/metabolite transporter (DMT)-like permease